MAVLSVLLNALTQHLLEDLCLVCYPHLECIGIVIIYLTSRIRLPPIPVAAVVSKYTRVSQVLLKYQYSIFRD